MLISHTVSFAQAMASQALAACPASHLVAVDATVGGGNDTLFLSRAVGEKGRVYGFDIQARAIEKAKARLGKEGAGDNVTLFHDGHENMARLIPEEHHGIVSTAMFNLGYLPGSDGRVITTPENTIMALDAALALMRRGGIAVIVMYTGHPGGLEEAEAVQEHCAAMPMDLARAMLCTMHNLKDPQTRIMLIEKR